MITTYCWSSRQWDLSQIKTYESDPIEKLRRSIKLGCSILGRTSSNSFEISQPKTVIFFHLPDLFRSFPDIGIIRQGCSSHLESILSRLDRFQTVHSWSSCDLSTSSRINKWSRNHLEKKKEHENVYDRISNLLGYI
jgi:hypothetical protein